MATTLFPPIDTNLHHRTNRDWQDKSFLMSLSIQKQNISSHHMRVTNSIVQEVVDRNDTHYLGKVNLGFRIKMGQTHELVRKIEAAVRENTHQATQLERCRVTLMAKKNSLIEPLNLCKKRMMVRESRPPVENIEDLVHTALEQQHMALCLLIEQLKNKANSLTDMLQHHSIVKEKLKGDLRDKKHASDLDQSCLQLLPETAPQYPPQEETLHTKITTQAGEVPPAQPTAILNGENAAGRFSYEWIFSQEEREALKTAFKVLANEQGEIMAMNFAQVYTDAAVDVDSVANPSVLEMMSLHPDTQLTWPKFCEMLAAMRSPSDPVTLPHHWRHKTDKLLENNGAVVMTSKLLLSQALDLMNGVEDVKRKSHVVVQKCLRRKIQETMDLRSLAERRIQETDLEIRSVDQSERMLMQSFEKKARPLAVSEARYNIRRHRKEGEEVHDEVEDLIAREVEELQKGVAAIQRELDNTRTTLGELQGNRRMLEADILNKNVTLEMDQRCLKMDNITAASKRNNWNAFLQGHI